MSFYPEVRLCFKILKLINLKLSFSNPNDDSIQLTIIIVIFDEIKNQFKKSIKLINFLDNKKNLLCMLINRNRRRFSNFRRTFKLSCKSMG